MATFRQSKQERGRKQIAPEYQVHESSSFEVFDLGAIDGVSIETSSLVDELERALEFELIDLVLLALMSSSLLALALLIMDQQKRKKIMVGFMSGPSEYKNDT